MEIRKWMWQVETRRFGSCASGWAEGVAKLDMDMLFSENGESGGVSKVTR